MSANAKTKVTEPNPMPASADAPAPPAAPAVADAIVEPAPAVAAMATPPLLVRVRLVTSTTVVRSFKTLRAAQATAIQRTLGWLTGLDAAMARSLTAGEQFLLTRLGPTPPPASE